jgi:hypothetical protein
MPCEKAPPVVEALGAAVVVVAAEGAAVGDDVFVCPLGMLFCPLDSKFEYVPEYPSFCDR